MTFLSKFEFKKVDLNQMRSKVLCAYMSLVKNLGGEGSKENFRGVIKCHEILEQICENLEGWPKFKKKMPFFGQIFPFLAQKKI
jgi:hypothetical protein